MIKQLQKWVSDLQRVNSMYEIELSLTSESRFIITQIFKLQASISDKLKTVKDDKDALEIYNLENKLEKKRRRLFEIDEELLAIGVSKYKSKE